MDVSIITVTRDDFVGLRLTYNSIESALAADNIEWIVVDGGDCLKTREFMETFAGRANVVYWRGRDGGIYDAMRKGVSMCTGEVVHFLNGGDVLIHAGVYLHVRSAFAGPGCPHIVKSHALFVAGDSWWIRKARLSLPWIYHGVTSNQQATFYLRSVFDCAGFGDGYSVCGDYALEAQCYRLGYKSVIWNHVTVVFFLGGISSRRREVLSREARRVQIEVLNAPRWVTLASSMLRGVTGRRVGRALAIS